MLQGLGKGENVQDIIEENRRVRVERDRLTRLVIDLELLMIIKIRGVWPTSNENEPKIGVDGGRYAVSGREGPPAWSS